MKIICGGVSAPKGFKASGIYSGIRKNPNKKDLALIYSENLCNAAAVYTQNKIKAAPLYVTHTHMQGKKAQAIICNSGNANACTENGIDVAESMCKIAASELGIAQNHVLVASTGVIGVPMSVEPIKNSMESLAKGLSVDGSDDCANAIMTTDTAKKEIAVSFEIAGKTVNIGAVAKGSGMIHPNMATMLCFITTDASVAQPLLQKALSRCISDTFNMISVDGDTSTNDMVLLLANGQAQNATILDEQSCEYDTFAAALMHVCKHLAIAIAKDGEGATKLLTCNVCGAQKDDDARALAKSVITSSLFKAAMFGEDANWGRVLCALGYADADFDAMKTCVAFKSELGEVLVCKNGCTYPFDEEYASRVLSSKSVVIDISVGDGAKCATAWGCDLTYDYVKINGDYRS